jgi:CubicO group peptidase (beta-lactamase class C family)
MAISALVPREATAQSSQWDAVGHVARLFVSGDYVPGISMTVVNRDSTLHTIHAGWADREARRPVTDSTVFYIASTTKSFTALAAALIAERGTWALSDPITRYLPAGAFDARLRPASITLESLLSHTHGIDNDGPVSFRAAFTGQIQRADMLRALASHPPAPTGREFSYSNIGYNVLSLAIDSLVGPWQDVLHDLVLEPAGLQMTSARLSDVPWDRIAMPYGPTGTGLERFPMLKSDRSMQAAGGIVSTSGDLARWIRIQLGMGRLAGVPIFPSEVIVDTRQSRTGQVALGDEPAAGYALGWFLGELDGEAQVYHPGGFPGYAAHVSFLPERGIGVAVVINGGLATIVGSYLRDLAYRVATSDSAGFAARLGELPEVLASLDRRRELLAANDRKQAARPLELALPLAAYTGTYQNSDFGTIRIAQWGHQLRFLMGDVDALVGGYDAARHRIRIEVHRGIGEVVSFEVADGVVSGLVFEGVRYDRGPSHRQQN